MISFSERHEIKQMMAIVQRDSTSAALQELVRFTGGEYCPTVSQSVSWCFSAVSSWADIYALLTLQQRGQKGERTALPSLCITSLPFFFFVLSLFPCTIIRSDAQLNNSRHLVGQLRQSTKTSRVWCRQQRRRKRASAVTTVCVRQDCPGSFVSDCVLIVESTVSSSTTSVFKWLSVSLFPSLFHIWWCFLQHFRRLITFCGCRTAQPQNVRAR